MLLSLCVHLPACSFVLRRYCQQTVAKNGWKNRFRNVSRGRGRWKLPYEACLILTTAANKSVAFYHERMPLVLEADKVNDWLHDETYALDCIQSPWEADLHALVV